MTEKFAKRVIREKTVNTAGFRYIAKKFGNRLEIRRCPIGRIGEEKEVDGWETVWYRDIKRVRLLGKNGYSGTIRKILLDSSVIAVIGKTEEMKEVGLFTKIDLKQYAPWCLMYRNCYCVFGENELELLENEGLEEK